MLRDLPYLPLYTKDFSTDEKLAECSAAANGIMIRLMCLLHKSDDYGTLLLKQKHKQSADQVTNFALQIAKHMPFDFTVIQSGLNELLNEKVIYIEGDKLYQKRMVKDNEISEKRAETGRKGGLKTQEKQSDSNKEFAKANDEAKHDIDINNEIDIIIDFLNKTCGSKFRKIEKTKKLINARFKEKFTTEDFKEVISSRFATWGTNPEMYQYLRPETLFGNKFEGYLQASKKIIKPINNGKNSTAIIPKVKDYGNV